MEVQDLTKNTSLGLPVDATNDLKKLLVQYTKDTLKPENQEVTLEMVITVLASQFPDLMLAISEESFISGYDQAFADMEEFRKEHKDYESD